MTETETGAPMQELRDNWWHLVAALPIFLLLLLPLMLILDQRSTITVLFQFVLVLSYPVALCYDARYVRALGTEWHPEKWTLRAAALAVVLTAGVLSFVVTPWYLYRRHQSVGIP